MTAAFIDQTHCFGLFVLALPTLLAGGTVLSIARFAPSEIVRALHRERATVLAAGPGYLEQVGDAAHELELRPRHLHETGTDVAARLRTVTEVVVPGPPSPHAALASTKTTHPGGRDRGAG